MTLPLQPSSLENDETPSLKSTLDIHVPDFKPEFRVWDQHKKIMVAHYKCTVYSDGLIAMGPTISNHAMPFSGVGDVRCQKIFLCDICQDPKTNKISEITFWCGSFRFDGYSLEHFIEDQSDAFRDPPVTSLRIIGNKFQNPELLSSNENT